MNNIGKFRETNLHNHVKNLFPICRSITGEGIRETLSYFENYHKEFKRLRFPTGKKVFDWEIPKEWIIRNAYLEHLETGKKYAEFKKNNLHLVGYSIPINMVVPLDKLLPKIYTLENQPDLIPYVTSYYKENWGFCMSDNEKNNLPKGNYKIFIDSELSIGHLDLSHAILKGESNKEILFSSYVCHPSMANNELSGPVVLNAIFDFIKNNFKNRKYTYRFIMQPETIGSISYLSKFKDELKENTICGFNLSCVGDERQYSFVNTPYKNTLADLALKAALIKKKNCKVYSFLERGSDERQYCSPEISLPVCTFSKSKFGEYPEYHTSADDLSIISNKGLNDSLSIFKDIISAFELGLYPKSKIICEPQLSKRGLYPNTSLKNKSKIIKNRMNFLAYCNGKNSIFEICSLINCELSELINEYILLRKEKVIE